MDVRSALGPVGILAGKVLGDVLTEEVLPLPLRGPKAEGAAPGETSRAACGGNGGRENCGDAFARNPACGAMGGGRGFGAWPCEIDFSEG